LAAPAQRGKKIDADLAVLHDDSDALKFGDVGEGACASDLNFSRNELSGCAGEIRTSPFYYTKQ
jgi:hypothetical protein